MKAVAGAVVGLVALGLFIGCIDEKPAAPRTANWNSVKTLSVDLADPEEASAVTEVEKNRSNYAYRLEVLQGFYHKIGNLDKWKWADSERKNLSDVKTFEWENVPMVMSPTGESLVNADERLLVEYAVIARSDYIAAVENVIKLYDQKRQTFKAQVVANMRDRLDPIRLYPYFPDSMLPPKDLRPTEEIPAANELYEKSEKLFRQGKGIVHTFITTSYEKQREACIGSMKLIRNYPRSTKIAMSAYYIAEINKEYFKENTLAVYWYERAWTWDTHLPEPARFQAATVYDIHLHNYAKAVECYRLSMQYDPTRFRNYEYSQQRIHELTGK